LLAPALPGCVTAVIKSPTLLQLVPSQDSVLATVVGPGASSPPNAKAAVDGPVPFKAVLGLFKSFTSVQLDPFQISVFAT